MSSGADEQGASPLHDQAAFIAAASILVVSTACQELPPAHAAKPQPALDAHFLFDNFVATYRELCQAGFRPTLVLRTAQLLAAGARTRLPPEFVSDVAAVCMAEGSADAAALHRSRWVGRVLLSVEDASSLDVDSLVRVCQCAASGSLLLSLMSQAPPVRLLYLPVLHAPGVPPFEPGMLSKTSPCRRGGMYTALIHASQQLAQPLLPMQALLARIAAPEDSADCLTSSAQHFLALYSASCLAKQSFPRYTPAASQSASKGGTAAPQRTSGEDVEAVQMAVLALLLWTDVHFCKRFAGCKNAPALHVRTRGCPRLPKGHVVLIFCPESGLFAVS